MFWTILAILSVLAGIALIWSVMVKKFPQLKLIDLSTLAKERHREVKTRIIKDRFERSLGSFGAKAGSLLSGFSGTLGAAYDKTRARLKRLEHTVEHEQPIDPKEREARIASLLAEAAVHAGLERYGMAEERLIEALRLDQKSADAYRALSKVYLAQGSPEQAKETLMYLLRLCPEDADACERLGGIEAASGRLPEAEAYLLLAISLSDTPARIQVALADTYKAMGDSQKARDRYHLALEADPYNPTYLEHFLEACILLGDVHAAEETYVTLETAVPDHGDLSDFRSRIDALRALQT
jgi:tetratricopeptide (TPR) repeat protein